MKVLKVIGAILLIVIVVGGILSYTTPTTFEVEKSITIEAPKSDVKKQVLYFENSMKWSPWAKLDDDMEQRIEGEDGTVGATHHWDGNEEAGKGKQEIMSIDDNRIDIKLTFIEPFESSADNYFILNEKVANKTEVVWGFESEMTRPMNLMLLFYDMEKAIGKDYEKGLNNLKELTEKEAKKKSEESKIEAYKFEKRKFLAYRDRVTFDDMQDFYAKNLDEIYGVIMQDENLKPNGQPCGIYYDWDDEKSEADLAAAVPFSSEEDFDHEKFEVIELSGKTYKYAYYGDYEQLGAAHEKMHQFLEENDIKMSDVVLEEYVTDPETEENPENWLTNIYYFVNK
ncbi:MAG: SRPBCC family protein [Bacteroidota bacterium]